MKSYEVTYLVEDLRVKGYVGLPDDSIMTESEIAETVRRVTGAQSLLPVEPITYEPDSAFMLSVSSNQSQTELEAWPPPEACGNGDTTDGQGMHNDMDNISMHTQDAGAVDPGKVRVYPGLLYCRGGINRVGLSRLEWIATFCDLGFVVFAPWYRGTLQTDGRDEFGKSDVADSVMAFRILQGLSCVDDKAVTVLGFSRGSINATRTVIEEPTAKGLILWGGVADLTATYEERVDLRRMLRRVIGGTPKKVSHEYAIRSPLNHAQNIPCKTLVIHSTDDPQVAFHHGRDMYEALMRAGVPVTWHGYQGYAHHFHPLVRRAVMERMLDWALND